MTPRGNRTALTAKPIGGDEFAALMARFAPFERCPRLAVAVSGGADSLALASLAADWAAAREGQVIGLIVDHGLRVEAAAEARAAAACLRRLGARPVILTWQGEKPRSAVQARAREARYDLLATALRNRGLLHLLLGHHRDDQAETFLLRRQHASGPAGLAAMAAVVERPDFRLLRPLLDLPKTRLVATCEDRGLPWSEDPSNCDLSFERIRLRRRLAAEPVLRDHSLRSSRRAATVRDREEVRLACDLARLTRMDTRGWITLSFGGLLSLPAERGRLVLARCLRTVGGAAYAPRNRRLEALWQRLGETDFGAATLGGCRLLRQGDRLAILREPGRSSVLVLGPGKPAHWDGRFRIRLGRRPGPHQGALLARCLGQAAWQILKAEGLASSGALPPAAQRATLASLWDETGLLAVPALDWARPGWTRRAVGTWLFQPRNPLTEGAFTVV